MNVCPCCGRLHHDPPPRPFFPEPYHPRTVPRWDEYSPIHIDPTIPRIENSHIWF